MSNNVEKTLAMMPKEQQAIARKILAAPAEKKALCVELVNLFSKESEKSNGKRN